MAINIYYQNACGLRSKTNEFLRNVLKQDYDYICITETWLLPGIFNSELFDPRYNVYRTDRNYESTNLTRGGGTLIAVRREFSVELRDVRAVVALRDADVTWVDVSISQGPVMKKMRLFTCYFPQTKHQIESQFALFEYLSDLYTDFPDDIFMVMGVVYY